MEEKLYDTSEQKERIIVVGVATSENDDTDKSLDELIELGQTAGVETVAKVIQNREKVHPGTYIGKGKIEEVRELVIKHKADTVVCDDELSPAQLRNLESELMMKVMDRTMVILDIFAKRAVTSEGKIQVEAAQLKYSLARLVGLRSSLSRVGGNMAGSIGTRGPGEKKLELDRRLIKDRIVQLGRELEDIESHRSLARTQRMRSSVPVAAIVGYTNAGKSTLLNKLTQAGVLFVLLLALFVVTTGLCRLSSWLHHDTPGKYAVLVGTAAMPNCGFIGLPLCSALLGTARGTVFAGMAMASYNVWFFTYVVCLFRPGEKIRLKTFITPTNIATVAMLVLLATGWRLPAPVQQFCSAVGGCTTPLALMIVGVLLADSDIRALLHTGFLYRVTLLRGILFPLLFMLLLWLLPLDNVLRTGLSIIACCPAGSLAAVLAKQTGTEATLASQAVAHSTVCMLVTVPAMLLLTGVMFPM